MMWIILLSAFLCISLVSSLMLCICWKNKTPKNEWLGVDGMVTQKNPDENVNHLPSAAACMNGLSDGEAADKRNTISNSRRSLPDIPSEMAAGVTWDANGDNSSEHYATLGQYQNQNKSASSNRPNVNASISQHSSISQADDTFSPYERVKYDKIKSKLEHPYAQVQPSNSRPAVHEENLASIEERATLLRADIPTISANPTTPTRSRRSSTHSNERVDIPAATAVAGGIAASYELPYMTPPINFSGDSQDSSKGYTSISVREPLANIMAETNAVTNKQKRKLDVHYSTVSDDSDDVYTTIPDPNNPIYTSESETYARIPPLPITVEAEINIPPPERASDDREDVDYALYEPPPQHVTSSSDGLKHVTSHTHTHSRQASSSSSANFGSPKPEKRQANSPLPPPPPDLPNTEFFGEKLQVKRNLDDLYAKVHKTKKDEVNDDGSSEKSSLNGSTKGSIPVAAISEVRGDHNYETLKKSSTTISDFGYEKIKGLDFEPGYASINGPPSIATSSDPGYEALNQVSMQAGPNYEELRHSLPEPSNAGYSVVNKKKKMTPEPPEDPNYEQVLENPSDPNYAAVKSSGSESDPNYESVNRPDPNYESVNRPDPNYESVNRPDPNYESVNRPDPNYETLREPHPGEKSNSLSRTDSGSVGYEKIKSTTSESSNSASRTTESEPPYEQLRNEFDSDNVPGYEKVGSSGSSGNEIEPIQNEESEVVLNNIHDENAVVQV